MAPDDGNVHTEAAAAKPRSECPSHGRRTAEPRKGADDQPPAPTASNMPTPQAMRPMPRVSDDREHSPLVRFQGWGQG